jgi:hypothetical protein
MGMREETLEKEGSREWACSVQDSWPCFFTAERGLAVNAKLGGPEDPASGRPGGAFQGSMGYAPIPIEPQ